MFQTAHIIWIIIRIEIPFWHFLPLFQKAEEEFLFHRHIQYPDPV